MPNVAAADRHPESAGLNLHVEALPDQTIPFEASKSPPLLGFADQADLQIHTSPLATGEVAWISAASPFKSTVNEDSVATLPLSNDRAVMLVADGLGGHRGGHRASQLVKNRLAKACRALEKSSQSQSVNHTLSKVVTLPTKISENPPSISDPRSVILDEIENSNQRLIRSRTGAATTLSLAEINGQKVRSYQVGDSEILIVSQRGKVKYSTLAQSPIGYGVEAGLLSEQQALYHPDRHLVSNVIGNDQMTVEIGPWVNLSPRDTVLIASDGLFDNLLRQEIIDRLRKGKLQDSVKALASLARRRMILPDVNAPSKPDDLTIVVYRPTRAA